MSDPKAVDRDPSSPYQGPPMQADHATTIFERSRPGRRAATLPPLDVPERPLGELIPERLLRGDPAELPEVSEPEIIRHYNRISRRNFDLDSGFYPLGSCTMKHNPRLNERVAALPGHARLHPAQVPERAQGALELMWLLERALAESDRAPARLASAVGRVARRARRPAADPRVPRRARRAADQGADPRHGARHESRIGRDGRVRAREDRHRPARRCRPRRPAPQGRRRRRLPDAHQPQHARRVRRATSARSPSSSTRPAGRCTTTAPT